MSNDKEIAKLRKQKAKLLKRYNDARKVKDVASMTCARLDIEKLNEEIVRLSGR